MCEESRRLGECGQQHNLHAWILCFGPEAAPAAAAVLRIHAPAKHSQPAARELQPPSSSQAACKFKRNIDWPKVSAVTQAATQKTERKKPSSHLDQQEPSLGFQPHQGWLHHLNTFSTAHHQLRQH
jgi:hypothetical protein